MSDEAERLCPLSHPSPSRSARGTVLCGGHVARTLETLSQLATFDTEADEAAHDQTLSRKAGAPISGDRERPLVIADRFTDHSREVDTILRSWVLLVAEERSVGVPVLSDQGATPGLCAFLRCHHDWAVTRTWADDYAGEILALGRRAWALLHPSGNRQFVVGRCLERDEIDGSLCPGNLWARLTPSDPTFEVAADLACDTCDCTVPSTDWLKYGRRIIAAEQAERVA